MAHANNKDIASTREAQAKKVTDELSAACLDRVSGLGDKSGTDVTDAHSIALEIGGLVITLTFDGALRVPVSDSNYGPLLRDQPAECLLRVHAGCATRRPGLPPEKLVIHECNGPYFDRLGGRRFISMQFSSNWGSLRVEGTFDEEFACGDLYTLPAIDADTFFYGFGKFWLSVLLANYFGRHKGALFHACGVCSDGRGLAFVGPSGSGKSTLARLWQHCSGAVVLNDDTVIIRKQGAYRLYGTPWSGYPEARHYSSAPLRGIFFIGHAGSNSCIKLDPKDAARRLFAQPFLNLYDLIALEALLEFMVEIGQEVPCYELGFVPDCSVIELVKGVLA